MSAGCCGFWESLKPVLGGTVTSVSVANVNGVSGSVANPTTTPVITITLGAIQPTSIAISGTAGNGFISLLNQSASPSAANGSLRVYSDNNTRFNLLQRNLANSADILRTFIFPDSSVAYTFPSTTSTLAQTANQTFTGTTSFATISCSPDLDVTTTLGRFQCGSPTANIMFLSHFDNLNGTDYALSQQEAGATFLNSKVQINFAFQGGTIASINNFGLTINNGKNIIFSTVTGTKIGSAANEKLSFWNKSPIVQPTTSIAGAARVAGAGATVTDTDTFGGYTISQLAAILINTGLAT